MAKGIEIRGVIKQFRGMARPALYNVSLRLEAGSILGVIGPNGAGKTTLMGCLLGFLRPDSGEVLVNGRNPGETQVRRLFGYVPERLTFDRWMKASDFLAYHHALAGLSPEMRASRVAESLKQVGLDGEGGKLIKKFSRGMLQRLGLAQAVMARPSYLFLDEPTSGMDPSGVVLFKSLVREAAAAGATVVLNSHQLAQVEELCDTVCFLREGRLEAGQSMQDFKAEGRFVLRWMQGFPRQKKEFFEELAHKAGCALADAESKDRQASFSAPGEEARANLIAEALKAGLPLVEAGPETRKLESLFQEKA